MVRERDAVMQSAARVARRRRSQATKPRERVISRVLFISKFGKYDSVSKWFATNRHKL